MVRQCPKGCHAKDAVFFKVRQWMRHVHKWCVIILFQVSVNLLKWCITFHDGGCVMLPKRMKHLGTLTHHSGVQ